MRIKLKIWKTLNFEISPLDNIFSKFSFVHQNKKLIMMTGFAFDE